MHKGLFYALLWKDFVPLCLSPSVHLKTVADLHGQNHVLSDTFPVYQVPLISFIVQGVGITKGWVCPGIDSSNGDHIPETQAITDSEN